MRRRGKVKYDRVAMLRSDVFYVTPFDMFETYGRLPNSTAVVPGFGRRPVSDRMIVGPPKAVEIWATQRFARQVGSD